MFKFIIEESEEEVRLEEHRNVVAGFAFVNFISPQDVLKLFLMARSSRLESSYCIMLYTII